MQEKAVTESTDSELLQNKNGGQKQQQQKAQTPNFFETKMEGKATTTESRRAVYHQHKAYNPQNHVVSC